MDAFEQFVSIALGTAINMSSGDTSVLKVTQATIDFSNILWEYLSLLGIGLTLTFFIVELNKIYAFERNDMTLKSIFAPFLKLVIAIVVLMNASSVIGTYLGWHNSFIDWATTNIDASHVTTTTTQGVDYDENTGEIVLDGTTTYNTNTIAENLVKDLNLFGKLTMLVVSLLSMLVSFIMQFLWQYKGYLFQFELLYRIGITPVALADVYSGQNANAVKWLKGFISLSLYGVAFIFIPRVSFVIVAGTLSENLANVSTSPSIPTYVMAFLSCLIVPVASFGVLSTAKEMSKEVLA